LTNVILILIGLAIYVIFGMVFLMVRFKSFFEPNDSDRHIGVCILVWPILFMQDVGRLVGWTIEFFGTLVRKVGEPPKEVVEVSEKAKYTITASMTQQPEEEAEAQEEEEPVALSSDVPAYTPVSEQTKQEIIEEYNFGLQIDDEDEAEDGGAAK